MVKLGDTVLCPLISWSTTFQRVRMIPESSYESEVCFFLVDNNKSSLLRADRVRSKLQAIIVLIGEDALGFDEI